QAAPISLSSLPLRKVELIDSTLLLHSSQQKVSLPITGQLINDGGRYDAKLSVLVQPKPIELQGKIARDDIQLSGGCEGLDLNQLAPGLLRLWPKASAASGIARMQMRLIWQPDHKSIWAQFEPANVAFTASEGAQSNL